MDVQRKAMRKICPNCGRINPQDSWECDNCKEDIDEISPKAVNPAYKYFYDGEYSNSPKSTTLSNNVKSDMTNTVEIVSPTHTVATTQNNDSKAVKLCPVCQAENSSNATECIECGNPLIRVASTVKAPEQVNTEKDEPSDIYEDFLEIASLEEKEQYYILIGKNGDNKIPVTFTNDTFVIGRNYQSCLPMNVSRIHCFIRRDSQGRLFLGESLKSPSTYGTYIRIINTRTKRVEPGNAYPISSGTVFYLDDVPVVFMEEVC